MFLGDAADDERYEESAAKDSGGLDSQGNKVKVENNYDHGHLHLLAPQAQVLWITAEYGFWRKTVKGWQEGTKRDPGRTISSAWHMQYAKLVKEFTSPQKVGLELEIVLMSVSEKEISGVVYLRGKPAAQVPVHRGHRKIGRTKDDGSFQIRRKHKQEIISAIVKESLENNADADYKILTSTLTLE